MNARNRKRILVVDDQPSDRELLVRSFAQQGFVTTLAANGDEATRRLAHEQYDAVLTDLDVPQLTGFELLRIIHQQHPRLPVILMTKLFEERMQELLFARLSLGAAGVLRKPLASKNLATIIQLVLRQGGNVVPEEEKAFTA